MHLWIAGGDNTPPGSCARHLAKRINSAEPFSPRLRQAGVRAIERIWSKEFEAAGLESVRWLNRLNIDVDDMVEKTSLARLLVGAIRSPTGHESLSSHYWDLLDKLIVASKFSLYLAPRDTEVMRLLEGAEEWEKLGIWMVVVWSFLPLSAIPKSESMGGIEEVTRKSHLRPSTLQALEDLCEAGSLSRQDSAFRELKDKLRRMCNQARTEQMPPESLPPQYVAVCPNQRLLILMSSLFCFGQPARAQSLLLLPFAGDHSL